MLADFSHKVIFYGTDIFAIPMIVLSYRTRICDTLNVEAIIMKY